MEEISNIDVATFVNHTSGRGLRGSADGRTDGERYQIILFYSKKYLPRFELQLKIAI